MTPERWQQIEQIFQTAFDQPEEKRSSYLDQVCKGDPELRREVESLFEQDRDSKNPIAAVVSDAIHFFEESESDNEIGKHIGPYRITEVIGQGGMGIVYCAIRDDDEYRKQVALKVVKHGLDTRHIISRFRQERQILASLDHTNIARLLDGGTSEEGFPYFVMEYIDGHPITQYCAAKHLQLSERLKLFQQVCAAVQYAHQKLVIHRDIKPSNILVAEDGTPKLLDFGIAKLLNPDSGSQLPTETMTFLRLMTPDYASPEQVRGLPISTTTDVYSLGAVLYELLTGQRAHQFKSYTPTEIERVICFSEAERPSAAAKRSIDSPARMSHLLSGDVDNIVLMAMRKEPERRYQSAGQFSEDIARYLLGRPVIARSDTILYRAGKFVRRHKLGVLAMLLVISSLIGGLAVSIYQARRAERRFEQVRKLANTFLFDFHDSIKDLPGSTKAREMVVRTALDYLDSLAREAKSDPSLQLEVAEAYRKVGDVQGDPRGPNLGQTAEAMKSYRKSLALSEDLATSDPDNLQLQCALANCFYKVGDMQVETGDIRGGMAALRSGIRSAEKAYSMQSGNQTDLLLLIRTQRLLGDAELKLRDPGAALRSQTRALKLSQEMVTKFPSDFSQHHFALTLIRLGEAQAESGDLIAAIGSYTKVKEIRQELVQRHPLDTAYQREWRLVHTWLGNFSGGLDTFNIGDKKAALDYHRKALSIAEELSADDPKNAMFQHDLSLCYAKLGETLSESDPADAVDFYQKAIAINDRLLAVSPSEFRFLSRRALYSRGIAVPLRNIGSSRTAIENLNQSLETLDMMLTMNPDNAEAHASVFASRMVLAETLLSAKDLAGALENYRVANRIAETSLAASPSDLYAMWRLADSYQGLGRYYLAVSQSQAPESQRIESWRNARISFQKSYEIWNNWTQHAISTVFNTSRRDQAAQAVLRCDQGIAKLAK
jgi:eukaryotic-like serine/threonine-protein kinase